jgi:hypothetical protein
MSRITPGLRPNAVHLTDLNELQLGGWKQLQDWDPDTPFTPQAAQDLKRLVHELLEQNLLDQYNSNATAALRLNATRKELSKLEQDLTTTQAALAAAEEEVEAARATANRYQQEAEALRADLSTAHHGYGGKKQDIAAPDKFTGDRKTYPAFKAQLQAKLAGDARKFEGEQHRMLYVSSLLQGNAYAMILPHITEGTVTLESTKELWKILDGAYEDPDKKGTARRELKTLKQGAREFSAFFADFQRLMATLGYDEEAKKSYLEDGLNDELLELMMAYDLPTDWHEYVTLLQRLDSRIRARAPNRKTRPVAIVNTNRPAPSTPAAPRPAAAAHPTANPNYHGPAPMDLSAAARETEKQRVYRERMAQGACTSCGVAGHFRKDCPGRAARMAAYQAQLQNATTPEVQSGNE